MKYLATIIFTFAFGALTIGYGEPAKVDFSGDWQLDKTRSEGVPPGSDQSLSIKQEAARLEVKIKLSGPDGDRTLADSYTVDGKEGDFTPALIGGGSAQNARRTSTWSSEGKGFDVTERADVEGPDGTNNVKATRTWRLSEDGKTLTIEMAIDQGTGSVIKSKRVFTRK